MARQSGVQACGSVCLSNINEFKHAFSFEKQLVDALFFRDISNNLREKLSRFDVFEDLD
jgi:hypothetical protein